MLIVFRCYLSEHACIGCLFVMHNLLPNASDPKSCNGVRSHPTYSIGLNHISAKPDTHLDSSGRGSIHSTKLKATQTDPAETSLRWSGNDKQQWSFNPYHPPQSCISNERCSPRKTDSAWPFFWYQKSVTPHSGLTEGWVGMNPKY